MGLRQSVVGSGIVLILAGPFADGRPSSLAARGAQSSQPKESKSLEFWPKQLKSTKVEEREEAARELRNGSSSIELLRAWEAEPFVRALADALADSSPSVRRDVAYALCSVGLAGDQVVTALTQATQASDESARFAARLALWKMTNDESSYSSALKALKHESASVRLEAAQALGAYAHHVLGTQAHNEKTVLALVRALKDSDDNVRTAARNSLLVECGVFRSDAKPAVPALIETLGSTDPALRFWAASALGGVGPDAQAAVPALLQALRDQDERLRHTTAWTLGRIGTGDKTVVPALAAALADNSAAVRFEAAFALGFIGAESKSAVSTLQTATRDKAARVRVVAQLALWRATAEEQFVRLAMAEIPERDPAIQLDAFVFFSCIGGAALPMLTESLQHREASVRKMAAYALSEIALSAAKAIPALIQALRDPDREVRQMAAFALGQIGPLAAEAASALAQALGDPDPDVRDNAAYALKAIDREAIRNRRR